MFGSWNPAQAKIFTANTLIKKGQGQSTGILCAQSSSLVVSVYDTASDDSAANAVKIVDSIPMTAGNPYAVPYKFNYGLYVKVVSGTGSATAFYD
jgi:hypothetical protein